MALHQRDYILRLIESVAAAVARVLKRRSEGDLAGARRELRQAMDEVLGPGAAMLPMVDSQTAVNLVSDPQRLVLYARLLELDADLLADVGQPAESRASLRRALEILLELVLRKVELPDEALAQLDALRPRVASADLAPRYRQAGVGP
jgi:hypothetical protein